MVQLTEKQKLEIRSGQFQVMKLRDQARQLQDQSVQIERSLIEYLNKAALEMKIDITNLAFNADTLEFSDRSEANQISPAPVMKEGA